MNSENQVLGQVVIQQVVGIDPTVTVSKIATVSNADGSVDSDGVIDSAGDSIYYTLSATNTGDTTLSDVTVIDPLISASMDRNGDGAIDSLDITGGDENGDGLLDIGETWVWDGTYQITQDDINQRGNYDSPVDSDAINDNLIRNSAYVSSAEGASDEFAIDTTLDYDPQIRVIKTADVFNADGSDDLDEVIDTAGDEIAYTVTVENIGNVTLNNVQLTDELSSSLFDTNSDGTVDFEDILSGDENDNNILDVGEAWVFKGNYSVTQDEIDNRGNYDGPDGDTASDNVIRNVVSITTQSLDQQINGSDDAFTEVDYRPVILLEKVAALYNPDGTLDENGAIDSAGEVIKYSLTVENAGNVTLSNVVLSDPLISESMDKDNNGVINVLDSDGGDTNLDGILNVGETWSFSGQYEITQADIDARGNFDGQDVDSTNDNIVRNFAGVSSLSTDDQSTTRDTFVDTRVTYSPVLTIDKVFLNVTDGNGNGLADAAGDQLNYRVVVTNSGNVTLTDVTVTDPLTQQAITGLTLAPGESQEFESSYTLKQSDLDDQGGGDGDIDNTATVDSTQTDSVSDDAAVALAYTPTLLIDKVFLNVTDGNGNGLADAAGDQLNYRVVVTNSGNVTLTDVTVTDPLTQQAITGLTLAPGESQEFESSYTLKQSDLDDQGGGDGDIDNTATVDSTQTDSVSDDAAVALAYTPDLMILKTADVERVDEIGDLINYTIAVSNIGNITLTGLEVTDTLIDDTLAPRDTDLNGVIDGDTDADGDMDVGETWYWTGQYMVTPEDFDAAAASADPYYIRNIASVDSDQTDSETSAEEVALVELAFEGLSPGYWKNHPEDWDGVTSNTSFEEFFFGSTQPDLNWKVKMINGAGKEKFVTQQDITLMEALTLTGGDAAALARQAVAGVLNTRDEDVTYRFTEGQLKEWVSEALSNQPVDLENDGIIEFEAGLAAIQGVKDLLAYNNNLELV